MIALDNIDEVIAIIKASANGAEAKERLIARFGFSERQAQAIRSRGFLQGACLPGGHRRTERKMLHTNFLKKSAWGSICMAGQAMRQQTDLAMQA